jgi:nucleoside-diphosphate-sugar epimerase
MYMSYARNFGMEIHIARFHNIFGPFGTWDGGREKAPAAMCRKVAETPDGGSIEIWGDGEQTRTFLYIDECIEGIRRLMASEVSGPINIGSDELISINGLAKMAMNIAGKKLSVTHIPGPLGVRGRSSDNTFIKEVLGWSPTAKLIDGMKITYQWIAEEVKRKTLKS